MLNMEFNGKMKTYARSEAIYDLLFRLASEFTPTELLRILD